MTVIRFLQNVKKILHCIYKNQIPAVFCNTNDNNGPTPLNLSVKNRLSHSLCTWKSKQLGPLLGQLSGTRVTETYFRQHITPFQQQQQHNTFCTYDYKNKLKYLFPSFYVWFIRLIRIIYYKKKTYQNWNTAYTEFITLTVINELISLS